ncbi:hypothetical protein JCM33374_g1061 [Metschnikowia sp. JCM 33374]|nr:hypothetical protein JCM33374_g1061 [Metschnikowia sp. JCM 33374]
MVANGAIFQGNDVVTKKQNRLQPSKIKASAILKWPGIYTDKSETFGDVKKDFNNKRPTSNGIIVSVLPAVMWTSIHVGSRHTNKDPPLALTIVSDSASAINLIKSLWSSQV